MERTAKAQAVCALVPMGRVSGCRAAAHAGRSVTAKLKVYELDKMTPEQRARFEAHCAEGKAKPPCTCIACGKELLDPGAPGKLQLVPGVVSIPFFGHFCSKPVPARLSETTAFSSNEMRRAEFRMSEGPPNRVAGTITLPASS
jgi:hypothetical protein